MSQNQITTLQTYVQQSGQVSFNFNHWISVKWFLISKNQAVQGANVQTAVLKLALSSLEYQRTYNFPMPGRFHYSTLIVLPVSNSYIFRHSVCCWNRRSYGFLLGDIYYKCDGMLLSILLLVWIITNYVAIHSLLKCPNGFFRILCWLLPEKWNIFLRFCDFQQYFCSVWKTNPNRNLCVSIFFIIFNMHFWCDFI